MGLFKVEYKKFNNHADIITTYELLSNIYRNTL